MDEIDALNEEWNKIKSKGLSVYDSGGGGNSNSSDACSSSQPRRKRSRWSDDKVSLDQFSNGSVENTVQPSAAVTDFSQSVCKLVEERKSLQNENQESCRPVKTEGEDSNGRGEVNCDMPTGKAVGACEKVMMPGPHSFRLSDNDSEGGNTNSLTKSYKSKRYRKYRHKKGNSSSSESDNENTSFVKLPTTLAIKRSDQKKPIGNAVEPACLSEPLSTSMEPSESTVPDVGPFLEKKATVVVKNVADWVTSSHILQDVKNAKLRSYEDAGIVRKRERGAPYRYAYVDFLTHTSARRWIDIRKGHVVIGSQQYQMELTLRDWECPKCKVFNFGKSVVCHSCRNSKKVLKRNNPD